MSHPAIRQTWDFELAAERAHTLTCAGADAPRNRSDQLGRCQDDVF
jgi:hypothetical protein